MLTPGRLLVVGLLVGTATALHADVSGSWRFGFSIPPETPPQDSCRFDLEESPPGQVQGWLGRCALGTDGVVSGTVDGAGALVLQLVAPDDAGCEAYRITGTVAPGMDATFPTATVNGPDELKARHGQ